ncbi:hypothetical protein [Arthrobacter sp. KK5.5]|uniref:hypothetical protein n=1 Tax=Arthrobacter sp. KK5.5 TaxID=3373084 RepID=UPI003EE450EB
MQEPIDALASLRRAVKKAKRKSSVQFPVSFVRSDGDLPPLARLMKGGRGGEVRLRLYLTLAMQATKHPYTLPARTSLSLARMLSLPIDTGPRQVAAALRWLERNRLLVRDQEPGKAPSFRLLSPDGTGEEWAKGYERRYMTLPIELWSDGWILRLNGRSLAVYVALRELTGGKPIGEVMDGHRKRQYGMSDDTWTRATRELMELGLLIASEEIYGDDTWIRRRRKRYRLVDLEQAGSPSWTTPSLPSRD